MYSVTLQWSSSRRFDRLLKAAGLPHIRFHDTRHTFATIMLELGESPKVVQEILGHSRISVTLDLYSHVSLDLEKKAASRLNEALRVDWGADGARTEQECSFITRCTSCTLSAVAYLFSLPGRLTWPFFAQFRPLSDWRYPEFARDLWNCDLPPIWRGRCPSAASTELWVLIRLASSIIAYYRWIPPGWWFLVLALDVFRIPISQANVLLFDALKAARKERDPRIHSYTRSLILLVLNYAELVFWFGYFYGVYPSQFLDCPRNPLLASWRSMVSMGASAPVPVCTTAHLVVWSQSVIALFMLLVAVAMLVNQFPRRGTKDRDEAAVTNYRPPS